MPTDPFTVSRRGVLQGVAGLGALGFPGACGQTAQQGHPPRLTTLAETLVLPGTVEALGAELGTDDLHGRRRRVGTWKVRFSARSWSVSCNAGVRATGPGT